MLSGASAFIHEAFCWSRQVESRPLEPLIPLPLVTYTNAPQDPLFIEYLCNFRDVDLGKFFLPLIAFVIESLGI